ncbi:DUF3303 domain-containing protein [Photobacterium sp. TY1-4]|uniref:DUF3303 domain-containing protein n=1 Tax=Photobacterium sp. TY1-4 TaxID=2899122 RepID=UPI0021BFBF90|nr:DUF3303 domain-containing protein [Photobacterium sp. TY1-4]UXI03536.1 DUF3303 domain-containing protein [Photobacterium sp. TY1-4]
MTFLVTWQLHQGKLHPILAHFSQLTDAQDQEMMGEHVKMIGRWHDLVSGTGVAVCESDNIEEIMAYALRWNNDMDISVQVVVDDAQAKALGSQLLT